MTPKHDTSGHFFCISEVGVTLLCPCGKGEKPTCAMRVDTVGELQSQTGQGFTMALPTVSSRERKQRFLSFHDQLLRTNPLPVPN